jgi:iron(III) transport system permease protein
MKALGRVFSVDNFTLDNFPYVLFKSSVSSRALINSLILALAAATVTTILGSIVAIIKQRTRAFGRSFLDYISFIPLGIPGIAIAVGLIFAWYRPPLVLAGTLWILLFAYIVRYVPFGTRTANASLQQMHPSLEECARLLGASWLQTYRRITVPLIRTGLFAGWLLAFMPSLRELNSSIMLYSTRTETTAVSILEFYNDGMFEHSCAMGVIILVLSVVVYIFARRVMGKGLMEI